LVSLSFAFKRVQQSAVTFEINKDIEVRNKASAMKSKVPFEKMDSKQQLSVIEATYEDLRAKFKQEYPTDEVYMIGQTSRNAR
jgi:hypothetical protein